jgi:hypothetical protein
LEGSSQCWENAWVRRSSASAVEHCKSQPAIACSRDGDGGDGWGNLTIVQCKAIGNWHNESPLYNEYMLIKEEKKKRDSDIVALVMN